MKSDYKMTTVYEYASIFQRLLDNDLTTGEKSVKKAVERYLYRTQQAKKDADILERLLA